MLDLGAPGSLVGNGVSVPSSDLPTTLRKRNRRPHMKFDPLPEWRRDALRTTLWVLPAGLVALSVILFVVTYLLDRAAFDGHFQLPGWMDSGSPDAARQVLIAIAVAVITIAGVVFSVVIVALTLASQQFGPRMLRSFIRDFGTQFTLAMFMATFVYCVLALGSISSDGNGQFVPHISITVALGLLLADLAILIYFIHHVAVSIQLNEVIAGIGQDFGRAIEENFRDASLPATVAGNQEERPGHGEPADSVLVAAARSGYLQVISRSKLVEIASSSGATIDLLYWPGHFVVAGRPLARVSPASAAPFVARGLDRGHIVGRHRTLSQDPVFAVDQLVEIAIRALSPAVNDTFTALVCIDWLTAGLCQLGGRSIPTRTFRDGEGSIRVMEAGLSYERVVDAAFDKIRQAGRGMPAVAVRLLDSLAQIMATTGDPERQVLLRQADMILRASDEAIPEEMDRAVVRERYHRVLNVWEGHTYLPTHSSARPSVDNDGQRPLEGAEARGDELECGPPEVQAGA
jgi:uncharacterized membrane protein